MLTENTHSERKLLVYAALVLAMFFWGLSFVWTKMVFEVYRPFTVVFLRMLVSSLLLLVTTVTLGKRQTIARRDWRWFFLLAFFEPFCYFLGESFGLLEVSASVSALIIATIPLFATLASPLFAPERIAWTTVVGIALSFCGLCLTVLDRNMNLQYSSFGIACLFFAVFSAVGYNIMAKKLSGTYSPLTIVGIQNLLGAVMFLPLFLGFEIRHFLAVRPDARVLGSLVSLTLFASTFAFLLYVFSVARLGVVRANVFTNLIPLFATLFSVLWLAEVIDLAKGLGMGLILGGVVLAQFRRIRSTKAGGDALADEVVK